MRFAPGYALASLATFAAAGALFAPPASAQEKTLKLGGLATLEGVFAKNGEDSMRGIEMAIKEYKNTAGGYKIELVKASSDAKPDTAIRSARKLIEQDGVRILVGPLSGSEGLAMKDFAKTKPEVTFINGSSAAQDTTLRDPAPNFFRYSSDGAQWSYGLGEHVYKTKGWKKVASLAEDYSFPYTQFYGFALEYCALGGKITHRSWVPLGTKDYASVIAALPQDVDAIYVVLGGADAIAFLNQYQQAGGKAKFIAGSITVDPAILTSRGRAKEALVGTPAGSPIADNWDDPNWQKFVKLYQDTFPADQRFPTPSLFAANYYIATKAALDGLNAVKGDLSNNHAELRKWMSTATIDTPVGKIKLDENRQAVAPNFVTEVAERPDGSLYNKVAKVIPSVNQTLNMDRAKFMAIGPVGRDNPNAIEVSDRAQRIAQSASARALEIEGVSCHFGALVALDGVTLTLRPGERRAVLGANGAGKTTLFNVITGDFPPRGGSVRFFGEDVTSFPPHERIRRGLRRTYQISLLFQGLSVLDNLYLATRGVTRGRYSLIRRAPDDPTREAARELAHVTHLDAVANQTVSELSYGQQRQLEIGMALAGAPRFVLFDEPAAGLSPADRRELVAILRALPLHIGYIVIEHDLDVALRVVESVTVMHNGRVFKEGTPEAIEADAEVQSIYLGAKHG